MKCITLKVSGRVQGVFFRANAKEKAVELGINGYARNLPNGDVEIVAEGDEGKLGEFIEFIKESPGSAEVTDIIIKNRPMENFSSFKIKY